MKRQVETHRDLRVWRDSMHLAESVYRATSDFPASERFGLLTQMRRAAVSVVSNIAEGAARNSPREFLNFLGVAHGSLAELEAQIVLANRLGFIADERLLLDECHSCAKLLSGLVAAMRRRIAD